MDTFFRTPMGRKFFDGTMPKIADQLERLNDNLEALLAELCQRRLQSTKPQGDGPTS